MAKYSPKWPNITGNKFSMEQWHIAHHGKNLIPFLRDSHHFMHFFGIFTLFDENYDKFGTLGVCPQLVLCK